MKVRVVRRQEGAPRFVQPFPSEFPEFEVEALDLGSIETGKVFQRYGAGGRNPALPDQQRAYEALCDKSIVSWRGEERLVSAYARELKNAGVIKDGDKTIPAGDAQKKIDFFLGLQFEESNPLGGETFVSVHEYAMRALRADVETERKN